MRRYLDDEARFVAAFARGIASADRGEFVASDEVWARVERALLHDGINLITGCDITSVERREAAKLMRFTRVGVAGRQSAVNLRRPAMIANSHELAERS